MGPHYAARGYCWTHSERPVWQFGESFDRVFFSWHNRQQRYHKPQWKHLGRAGLEKLLGEAWPEPQAMDQKTYYGRGRV